MNIALLCEKLHVLPDEGGLFSQDEQTINRLIRIYDHLEEWREHEMKRAQTTNVGNEG